MTLETDPRNENDRTVFRRVGIMLAVWIVLLVVAGLLLLYFGSPLNDLVLATGLG